MGRWACGSVGGWYEEAGPRTLWPKSPPAHQPHTPKPFCNPRHTRRVGFLARMEPVLEWGMSRPFVVGGFHLAGEMMPQVLFGLQSAFSLWMLVDAIRRGVACYWYAIILMPFGEIVYFFTVKVHDAEFLWLKNAFQSLTIKKPTLDQLRYRSEHSPCYENHVALAAALHDRKEYHEACGLFERVLRTNGDSSEALFGLACSQMGLEDYQSAAENLKALLKVEPAYNDYEGWTMLAGCLHRTGRLEEAVALTGQLVEKSPRLSHRIHHAHYLRLVERREESRQQLETALQEHRHAPRFLRRRQGALSRQAKQMLRQLA